jgi:uncharacterized membrane protein
MIFIVAGLLLGSVFGAGSSSALGAIFGALLGFLLSRLIELQDQVAGLEQSVAGLMRKKKPAEPEAATPAAPPAQPAEIQPAEIPSTETVRIPAPPAWEATPAAVEREASPDADGWSKPPQPLAFPQADQFSGFFARLFDLARTWLTTGNVPVKVGVIVSFFGVAFLLKYAVDRQLLLLPLELRLVGVSIFGMALLGFGWRLRERLPAYALSLQGGGVGILYLTIFAAMRFYELLPAGPAFALLIALTGFSGTLAVLQDSRALANLGAIGGFLAPILVSTGSGDHVMLFSYYLVLNAAILGIAWFRAWRELNIIGFLFTFVIGGVWGYGNYQPDLFASTEPFLLANFVFYQAVAILFAVRQEPNLKGVVDGTLVFGTPVVAFALQARLVSHFEYGLAISALVVALMYAATAVALFRARANQFRLLVESFLALGVAFATLAIPLALDARWTAAAWALEGAALVWVGVRQDRSLARLAGAMLLIGSGIAFANYGWRADIGMPVLNGNYLGGMLIGLASLFSARYLVKGTDGASGLYRVAGRILFFWGIAWCVGSGVIEIDDRVTGDYPPVALVAYLAVAAAALLAAGERLNWNLARGTVLAYLPTLLFPVLLLAIDGTHPLANFGWLAWPLALGIQYLALWTLRDHFPTPVTALHAFSLLAVTGLVMWEIAWQINQLEVSTVWTQVAVSVVPGLALLGVRGLRRRFDWPVTPNLAAYLGGCGVLVIMQLGIIGVLNLFSDGDPAPLMYVPLLNPLDLATGFAMIVALYWLFAIRNIEQWLTRDNWNLGLGFIGVAALVTSTAAVVRAVHHLGGVPWDFAVLSQSVLVQSALSIYWGILGFTGMVWGARAGQRPVWLTGAGLMTVVVVKLFLVDLGNTGSVERIVSFIGTGALLLIVGYFAPVPPRDADEAADEMQREDA